MAAGGVLPMAAAWRFGAAHHYRGEYPTALAYFEAAVADPDPDPVDRARFLAGYASVLWAQGNADEGRRIADEAMAAAQACGDDGAIGAAWVANGLVQAHAGDRTANLLAYEKALVHAERAGDVITVVRVRNNLGSRHVEAGRFRQALDELDHAVAVSEDHPVGLASAMVSVNRAEALLGLGRLEEAVGEIGIATEQFRGPRRRTCSRSPCCSRPMPTGCAATRPAPTRSTSKRSSAPSRPATPRSSGRRWPASPRRSWPTTRRRPTPMPSARSTSPTPWET